MSSDKDKKQGKEVATQTFYSQVGRAVLQGSVGAVVAATISAVTDPIVNRVLVKRVSVSEALRDVSARQMVKYFRTTLATNIIKFPMYEVLSQVTERMAIPQALKGVANGIIFTTATLPITNYRYCKSVGQPVSLSGLYKAYIPTVARDIVYGLARTQANHYIRQNFPKLNSTSNGQFSCMFTSVMAGCFASAPGNEVRGYFLQPKGKRLPVKEFFQFNRFIRSTSLGALVMAVSLGSGVVLTKPLESKFKLIAAKIRAPKPAPKVQPVTQKK